MQGESPPVDPATFMQTTPYQERTKILSQFWAENGFGAPKVTTLLYIGKLLFLGCIGGWLMANWTTGLNPLDFSQNWDQPIIWQKLIVWTMFLEALGVAGSWGPLAGHFKPMTGGVLYYARPGTIRLPPWPDKIPGTKGDSRTVLDVALYLGFLLALVVCMASPGTADTSRLAQENASEGLLPAAPILVAVALLFLLGFRDKVSFLQARAEQWVPFLLVFALFPFVDMIVAGKVIIVTIWVGAAYSKINEHFVRVIPPMVSNTPWNPSKKARKQMYTNYPEDLTPSKWAVRFTHVAGTAVEMGLPLVLLFSHNHTLTVIAAIGMIGFHMFIISTFPLAVPLEWNAMFAFITAFLFLGYPNDAGWGLGDMDAALLIPLVLVMLFFPILGNLRPDLVSFLPSLRQYSGNWASAMWAFAPGAEEKLDQHVKKPALMQRRQLVPLYGEETSEILLQQLLGWRAMHSQGRGMNSVMLRVLGEDINHYTLREAEFSTNALIGFNFGDGHFHDHRLIAALQRRCNFEPGEFIVVWVESEPGFGPGRGHQKYMVIDAAVGIVERGRWEVKDVVKEQPWLPNGPAKHTIEWQMDGYERRRHLTAPTEPVAAEEPNPLVKWGA